MSIYSDYKCGAMDEQEFHDHCARENRREREWIDEWERLADEEYEAESEDEE